MWEEIQVKGFEKAKNQNFTFPFYKESDNKLINKNY